MATTTSTFNVTGMTCSHCVDAVTEEVSKLDQVQSIDVDLDRGTVAVESDAPIDPAAFAAALEEAGYEVAS